MTKFVLRNRVKNQRIAGKMIVGSMGLTLDVAYRTHKNLKDKLLNVLKEYFDIHEHNNTSNKRGRGSLTKSRRYDKRKG